VNKEDGSNKIIKQPRDRNMKSVIPPRKNGKIRRLYDMDLYKLRHIIENTFLRLKDWSVRSPIMEGWIYVKKFRRAFPRIYDEIHRE
jgi:transposase